MYVGGRPRRDIKYTYCLYVLRSHAINSSFVRPYTTYLSDVPAVSEPMPASAVVKWQINTVTTKVDFASGSPAMGFLLLTKLTRRKRLAMRITQRMSAQLDASRRGENKLPIKTNARPVVEGRRAPAL